jgi:Zn-dependent peptidase ImmA (M78 family)
MRPSRYPGERVLRFLYEEKRFSLELIAKIFGVSREAVRLWMQKAGIKTRDRIYAVKTRGPKKRIDIKAFRAYLIKEFPELKKVMASKRS